MAESITKEYFPSQVAPDIEKVSQEYGLKVAKAIGSLPENDKIDQQIKEWNTILK